MPRTRRTRRTRLITATISAALLAGCGDDAELDADVEPREQQKLEADDPPPPPPGPEADADQDLLKQGAPKKDKEIGPDDVKDRYIVMMKPDGDPVGAAAAVGAKPERVFSKVIRGFAGPLNQGQLKALAKRPDVELVEPDQIVTADTIQPMDATGQPWGLDRIDERERPLDGQYVYSHTARGVRAYVIDTGIESGHPDYHNALAVYDVFGGDGQDCSGHGTHVAGTIGGNVHGVAKQTYLRGVRVLNCSGKGTVSGIIAGVDWVANNRIKPAVANMSLITGYSPILNFAVGRLSDSGVFVAVAAGNSGANACSWSPASSSKVFTVAASDKNDVRASWSNFGKCVTAYAPGVGVKSDWLAGGTRSGSGTSMASPHVAGVAALYKAVNGDKSSSTIKAELVKWATKNVIVGNPPETPNRLLFHSL